MENWLKSLFKVSSNIDFNIIKKAIIDYRIEGKNLMFELGRKYGLDISNPADYEKLISRTNENIPRKGKLSKIGIMFFMVVNVDLTKTTKKVLKLS